MSDSLNCCYEMVNICLMCVCGICGYTIMCDYAIGHLHELIPLLVVGLNVWAFVCGWKRIDISTEHRKT